MVDRYLAAWGVRGVPSVANDDYAAALVERMAELRAEHPDGDYPPPTHGIDDIGMCVECDARRCVDQERYGPVG